MNAENILRSFQGNRSFAEHSVPLKICIKSLRMPPVSIAQKENTFLERRKNTILLVSRAPGHAEVRKAALESAGLHVVLVTEPEKAVAACREYRPRLVMLGPSVPPAEKRRIWYEARKACPVPILELHTAGPPELMPPAYSLEPEREDEVIRHVKHIIKART